jgi:hypothetical protein
MPQGDGACRASVRRRRGRWRSRLLDDLASFGGGRVGRHAPIPGLFIEGILRSSGAMWNFFASPFFFGRACVLENVERGHRSRHGLTAARHHRAACTPQLGRARGPTRGRCGVQGRRRVASRRRGAGDPRLFPRGIIFQDRSQTMPGSNKEMARVVRNLIIRENEDVRLTVKALEARGVLRRKAELEIGRAFVGCLWEARNGMPDRWPAVLRGLRDGKSSAELFPDEPYDGKALGSSFEPVQ